jgi:hypothetical protein
VITEERRAAGLKNILKAGSLEDAVRDAQWIQESAFESYEVKQKLLEEIDRFAPSAAVVASSSSGLSIKKIVQHSKYPARCIIAIPLTRCISCRWLAGGASADIGRAGSCGGFSEGLAKTCPLKQRRPFHCNRINRVQREISTCIRESHHRKLDKAMTFGLPCAGPSWGLLINTSQCHRQGNDRNLGQGRKRLLRYGRFQDYPATGDVLQAGVDEELEHRPAQFGNTSQTLREYRDDKLLEVLRLHNKLDLG